MVIKSMYVIINDKKIEIEILKSFYQKLKGFMFQFETINKGFVFPKTNSIHTFFMFQKIDIVMTDKDNCILYMAENFDTERIILPKRNVYYTYELPLNSVCYLKIGDKLKIFNK